MNKQMIVDSMLKNSNDPRHPSPKLNKKQKDFIQGCTQSQLLDVQFLTTKMTELGVEDPETRQLQSLLKMAQTKKQTVELIRKLLLKSGTNVEQNNNDPFGDGDQSVLLGTELEPERHILRDLFAMGGDIEHHMRETSGLTSFAWNCIIGDTKAVEKALKTALLRSKEQKQSLTELLEYRETSMRVPPLILTVAMSKHKQTVNLHSKRNVRIVDMDHVGVVRTLIKYGARPNSKDVTGKTMCHYGAGVMATKETLEMTKMAIEATSTCSLFGQEVVLNGLTKTEYNGMKGALGGYDTNTNRRIMYPIAGSVVENELSLKPKNIFVVAGNTKKVCILDHCADNTINLVDMIDRLGSISMHEVAMSQRDDVATFLCKHSPTCLDVVEGGGTSIRRMMVLSPAFGKNKVHEVLKKHASKQAKKDEGREIHQKENCANCSKQILEGLKQCSICLVVTYCSKECQVSHWKKQHKKDCKRMEKEGELVLGEPMKVPYSMSTVRMGEGKVVYNYKPPSGKKTDEKFWIKVQSNGIDHEVMIYDKSRTCSFILPIGQSGHRELVEKVTSQTIFVGRKSYFKAKFNKKGKCVVYPHTSSGYHKW